MANHYLRVEYKDLNTGKTRCVVFVDDRGQAEWGYPLTPGELSELRGQVQLTTERLCLLLLSEVAQLRERVAFLENGELPPGRSPGKPPTGVP